MKWLPIALIALAPAAVVALQEKQPQPIPGWHHQDLAAGMAEAKSAGKPLMVVFR